MRASAVVVVFTGELYRGGCVVPRERVSQQSFEFSGEAGWRN